MNTKFAYRFNYRGHEVTFLKSRVRTGFREVIIDGNYLMTCRSSSVLETTKRLIDAFLCASPPATVSILKWWSANYYGSALLQAEAKA